MKKKCMHLSVVASVLVLFIMAGDINLAFAQEEKTSSPEYDSVTWQGVNQKREERDKGNFFTNMYWYIFKRREEQTYTGDEITVVQTASNVDLDSDDSPIQFVHVTSDN